MALLALTIYMVSGGKLTTKWAHLMMDLLMKDLDGWTSDGGVPPSFCLQCKWICVRLQNGGGFRTCLQQSR